VHGLRQSNLMTEQKGVFLRLNSIEMQHGHADAVLLMCVLCGASAQQAGK
jgi:hypothetical protein